MKAIILNADDFGPSEFINRGIIDGIEAGLVNSVSAVVTFGPASHEAIRQLHITYGDRIRIGLHLALTAGSPVFHPINQVSSLCPPVNGVARMWHFRNLRVDQVDVHELYSEIDAQFSLLGQILGGNDRVNHINSHHGILNFYLPFWQQQSLLLQAHRVPIRNPLSAKQKRKIRFRYRSEVLLPIEEYAIKESRFNPVGRIDTIRAFVKDTSRNFLLEREQEAIDAGIPMPSYFISQYYGQPHPRIIEQFLDAIDEGETPELMLHLGLGRIVDEDLWGIDQSYFPMRARELQALKDARLPAMLAARGINPVYYS